MPSVERMLAVDVGGYSLKVAEFSYPQDGGVVLENFAFYEYEKDLKDEDFLDTLLDAFKHILAENEFSAKKVNISISGQSAFVRFVKLPPIGKEEDKVKQLVEYEARQNMPFPMEEVVWDFQLISTDNEESEEIEAMFVVVKNEFINPITDIIQKCGKEIVFVEIATTSSYNAARANEIGDEECAVILNIGGRCSSLIFIDRGRFFVRSIPIAGLAITQQISKEFNVSLEEAEEMKKRHGFIALGGTYEEPDSEVAATVSKIVRNVMTKLHGEINRSINVYRSQQKGLKPEKLFLAGGSSVMAFTPRFFSEKLRIPVEYLNPFQVVSIPPDINKDKLADVAHMFSEVIGLGLRNATTCPIEISLTPESLKKQQAFRHKVPYFFASAISLIICLLIMYWGVSQHKGKKASQHKAATISVKAKNAVNKEIKEALISQKRIIKKYKQAKSLLSPRDTWIELIEELQKALPKQMWLTEIKLHKKKIKKSNAPKPLKPGILFGRQPSPGRGGLKIPTVGGSKYHHIQVKGHSLIINKEQRGSYDTDQFKEKILKSRMFTNIEDIFFAPAGKNNITSFTMEIKLKTAIIK